MSLSEVSSDNLTKNVLPFLDGESARALSQVDRQTRGDVETEIRRNYEKSLHASRQIDDNFKKYNRHNQLHHIGTVTSTTGVKYSVDVVKNPNKFESPMVLFRDYRTHGYVNGRSYLLTTILEDPIIFGKIHGMHFDSREPDTKISAEQMLPIYQLLERYLIKQGYIGDLVYRDYYQMNRKIVNKFYSTLHSY